MCVDYWSVKVYRCGHPLKQFVYTKECDEARKNGTPCTEGTRTEGHFASSKQMNDCEACNDEGYSRT